LFALFRNESKKAIAQKGWIEIDKMSIKFKIQKISSNFYLQGSNALSAVETFKLLWNQTLHETWMKQVKLNQKKNLHLLNEDSYVSTRWKYIASYFYISLNPKDDLKNHSASQILLPRKTFLGIHYSRANVNSFTLSQLLSNNFYNYICIGTHICIDEMIFDCHINSSVVSFIQRKPHPERILV
jgi:hypothetical protein